MGGSVARHSVKKLLPGRGGVRGAKEEKILKKRTCG